MRIFTSPAGRFVVGNCVLLFGPDAEPRGSGDLPQELDIHVQIAGHGQRFSGVTSGQDGSGQVFDGEQCGVIVKAAAQGAVIGHIADGQPGQPSGDVDAGKLFQRELQRIGAIGLPGKSGGTVRVDAIAVLPSGAETAWIWPRRPSPPNAAATRPAPPRCVSKLFSCYQPFFLPQRGTGCHTRGKWCRNGSDSPFIPQK